MFVGLFCLVITICGKENKLRKKIILIIPKLWLGGTERVVVKTAQLLSQIYDVCIVVFDNKDAVYYPECEVIDLMLPVKRGYIRKIINVFKRTRKVRKIKKEKKIDVSISFGSTANIVNVLSKYQEQVITEIRAFEYKKLNFLDNYILRKSDDVICCSNEIASKYINEFPKYNYKLKVIYNPYDIKAIENLGQEPVLDYKFNNKTVITHGRLNPIKDYSRLIKAFRLVKNTIPEAQLLIVGSGNEEENLNRLIKKLCMQDSIRILGYRSNPYAYLAKASLFVLSSFTEGFPNSLVEGMIFLPVISTDCPSGPSEILRVESSYERAEDVIYAEYGILVPPVLEMTNCDDIDIGIAEETLANAIISIMKSDGLSSMYRDKARMRAQMFSCQEYLKCLEDVIH